MNSIFSRVRIIALAAVALPLAGCVTDTGPRGVESVKQPVVSYSDYALDLQAGPGGLPGDEAQRLAAWLGSIGLGYGDQVSLAGDAAVYAPALRDDIATIVARHGLLIGEEAYGGAGVPPAGSVRLVVRRATAHVPGCPDWSDTQETNPSLAGGANFGCGVNGMLAAMVADPEDLLRGRSSDSALRTATSNKAIATWRDKPATGAGELKDATVQGSQ